MSGVEIIVSSHHGQYVPQVFASECNHWNNISSDDLDILSQGPDHEWYYETWFNVLNEANYTDKQGNKWVLYEDADLFAISEELMTEQEKQDFLVDMY